MISLPGSILVSSIIGAITVLVIHEHYYVALMFAVLLITTMFDLVGAGTYDDKYTKPNKRI